MSILHRFKSISTFVFSVDGVLTDGALYLNSSPGFGRRVHTKDGYALAMAVTRGYRVVFISSGRTESVIPFLDHLGVKTVFMGIADKHQKLRQWLDQQGVDCKDVLYMGDDEPDHAAMKSVGLACAPADAPASIKAIAHYISLCKGGDGCVRDVIEKVLTLNHHWDSATDLRPPA